jgi:hypothetical protein
LKNRIDRLAEVDGSILSLHGCSFSKFDRYLNRHALISCETFATRANYLQMTLKHYLRDLWLSPQYSISMVLLLEFVTLLYMYERRKKKASTILIVPCKQKRGQQNLQVSASTMSHA